MTKTKTKVPGAVDRRAKLLANLKRCIKESGELYARGELIRTRIFHDVYAYVEQTCSFEGRTQTSVLAALAKTLGVGAAAVDSWYYCGHFMREHNIPLSCSANSIRMIYNRARIISRASLLKAVDAAKKGKDTRTVRRIVGRDNKAALIAAQRRAGVLIRSGLTITKVKAEAMVLNTIAAKHFGKDVIVYVCDAKNPDKVLLETE